MRKCILEFRLRHMTLEFRVLTFKHIRPVSGVISKIRRESYRSTVHYRTKVHVLLWQNSALDFNNILREFQAPFVQLFTNLRYTEICPTYLDDRF